MAKRKSTDRDQIPDVRPDPLDLRDLQYIKPLVSLPAEYPKNALDILPKYAPLVKDQVANGPCTGYALAAMINFLQWSRDWRQQLLLNTKTIDDIPDASTVKPVSSEMLYHVARFYDKLPGQVYKDGSTPRAVMKGWLRHGVCLEEYWGKLGPNEEPDPRWQESAAECTIGAFYRVWKKSAFDRQNVLDMQAAIYETGAILVSGNINVDAWREIEHTGKQPKKIPTIPHSSSRTLGHAYALVGYTRDGFILLNSWGKKFGYHGFAIMPYDEWYRSGEDAWVAALGVPTTFTYKNRSGNSQYGSVGTAGAGREKLSGKVARHRAFGESDPIVASGRGAWSEERAYHHSVIINSRGEPLNRLIEKSSGRKALEHICHNHLVTEFEKNDQLNQIVIFAHSGLEPERIALRRAAVLGPYFYENGIYPLFISSQSGFMEPLGQMLLTGVAANQSVLGQRMDTALRDVMHAWTEASGQTSEARDAQIESVCLQLIRPLWTQFKHDAEVAAKYGGAIFEMADDLADAIAHKSLKKNKPGLHLVAHSAGAIHLGEFVRKMHSAGSKNQGIKAATCSLLAPACSLNFASRTFAKAVTQGSIKATESHFQIDVLSEENERRDNVAGIYGKSFLYLISRALEDKKYTPVLGMATAWSDDSAVQKREFGTKGAAEIKAWKAKAIGGVKPVLHLKPQVKVCSSGEYRDAAHNLFDNDVTIVGDLIKRISGRDRLHKRIGALKGF
ncbi:MAG: C1 family peptidase [Planctomycetaceae bacterium]